MKTRVKLIILILATILLVSLLWVCRYLESRTAQAISTEPEVTQTAPTEAETTAPTEAEPETEPPTEPETEPVTEPAETEPPTEPETAPVETKAPVSKPSVVKPTPTEPPATGAPETKPSDDNEGTREDEFPLTPIV